MLDMPESEIMEPIFSQTLRTNRQATKSRRLGSKGSKGSAVEDEPKGRKRKEAKSTSNNGRFKQYSKKRAQGKAKRRTQRVFLQCGKEALKNKLGPRHLLLNFVGLEV